MTDETTPAAAIVVTDSVKGDVTNTIARDLAIVVAAWPIILAAVGKHDALALAQWLSSDSGRPFLALILPVALTAWRVVRNIGKKKDFITTARSADNAVAIVVEKPTS